MAENTAIADTICRTIDLGVTIIGAGLDGHDRTYLYCELLAPMTGARPGGGRPVARSHAP